MTIDTTIDEINNKEKAESSKIHVHLMNGLNTEYSNSNKWWGYFPLANILGKSYTDLELNLTRFSIPQMVMGSTTT